MLPNFPTVNFFQLLTVDNERHNATNSQRFSLVPEGNIAVNAASFLNSWPILSLQDISSNGLAKVLVSPFQWVWQSPRCLIRATDSHLRACKPRRRQEQSQPQTGHQSPVQRSITTHAGA